MFEDNTRSTNTPPLRRNEPHVFEGTYSYRNSFAWSSDDPRGVDLTDTRYSFQPHERTSTSPNPPPPRFTQSPRTAPPAPPPPPPPAPPQPLPTLDELLIMSSDDISRLSVSNLKEVLYQNHVPARQILEKSELVQKVKQLITTEREERARSHAMHLQEEWEAQERERLMQEERQEEERRRRRRDAYRTTVESDSGSDGGDNSSGLRTDSEPLLRPRTPTDSASTSHSDTTSGHAQSSSQASQPKSASTGEGAPSSPPKPPAMSTMERNGLCVLYAKTRSLI